MRHIRNRCFTLSKRPHIQVLPEYKVNYYTKSCVSDVRSHLRAVCDYGRLSLDTWTMLTDKWQF